MSQENVEIVRKTLDVFARAGTSASFEELIANDVELLPAFEVTGGASFTGPDGIARFMRHWTEDFDDWTFRVDDLQEVGDAVVARMRQSARGKASGAPVESFFGVVFRLLDRKIARIEVFQTFAAALQAVGLEE
jgi:ketosteroid isomerase-like protein